MRNLDGRQRLDYATGGALKNIYNPTSRLFFYDKSIKGPSAGMSKVDPISPTHFCIYNRKGAGRLLREDR